MEKNNYKKLDDFLVFFSLEKDLDKQFVNRLNGKLNHILPLFKSLWIRFQYLTVGVTVGAGSAQAAYLASNRYWGISPWNTTDWEAEDLPIVILVGGIIGIIVGLIMGNSEVDWEGRKPKDLQ